MTSYMPLREATRDLHHAAEQHPIGGAMAAGTISPQAWADWLAALLVVHTAIDPMLPVPCWRTEQLLADLYLSNIPEQHHNAAAARYVQTLDDCTGAAYVFTGAHLMGGALIERRINGRLPCAHLRWDDRAAAIRAWSPYRQAASAEPLARQAFAAVIAIMDEIHHVGA
jgi:heme oxygenase